jgi:hypothetical protein
MVFCSLAADGRQSTKVQIFFEYPDSFSRTPNQYNRHSLLLR